MTLLGRVKFRISHLLAAFADTKLRSGGKMSLLEYLTGGEGIDEVRGEKGGV